MSMLASVWGGLYSPIIDKGLPDEEIRISAECFDVDSLYALDENPETRERFSSLHLLWTGYQSGGPFPPETIHDGLMESSWLGVPSAPESMTATVECANPMLSQAVYGVENDWPSRRQQDFDHEIQRTTLDPPAGVSTRLLPSSGANLANTARYLFPVHALPMNGFIVVRRNCPRDVVAFWNLRAAGATVIPLDADADVWRTDLVAAMSGLSKLPKEEGQSRTGGVPVLFHTHASPDLLESLSKSAVNADVELQLAEKYYLVELRERFTVSTSFERTFNAEVYRGDRSVDIDLPSIPLNGSPTGYSHYPGIVAADISFTAAENLDPRLAARLPGVRQQREILRKMVNSRQVRSKQQGVVCGVSGTSQSLQYGLFAKIDAIALLWGEKSEVRQSSEGQLQTRAAEMLGGVTSSMITESGIASALLKIGASPSGLTYSAIENHILNNRGEWPEKYSFLENRPREFARQRTHALMDTGLLIPSLELECTFCRIRTQISPDRLNTEVHCEFCGEEFRLALSLYWSRRQVEISTRRTPCAGEGRSDDSGAGNDEHTVCHRVHPPTALL